MAVISYNQILSAPVVTRAISRIKTPQSRFQSYLGMGPGGGNTTQRPGRNWVVDIFDKTRILAKGRAPATGPAVSPPNIIGKIPVMAARFHEKMHLDDERLFRIRPLGENWGMIDEMGQRYLTQQEGYMAQKFTNAREFMVSRLFRGGFDVVQRGDDWYPCELGTGTFSIDYKVPAGNKGQLDMLGDGNIIGTSWADAGANIIQDTLDINAAYEELHGLSLTDAWIDSTMYGYLLNNTGLKNAAGTANTVFQSYERSGFTGPDGIPDTGFNVVFRAIPWLTWHVYDAGLNIYDPTTNTEVFTKFIDSTHVIMHPSPSSIWLEMYEGSEPVRDNVLAAPVERFGLYAWTEATTQPGGFDLLTVDNAIPVLYIPSTVIYAEAVFT